ncbi:MAG: STAS domain-containing protein [Actinomycetota bacterium]|nr:STAS domain-containing protein [Actinomycetota bacterium]
MNAPGAGLEVNCAIADGVARIGLIGELDITGTDPLREALESAFDRGAARILIDLSQTSFIDSAGIALLLHCERDAHAADRPLRVVAPAGSEARLFVKLAGLGRILDLAEPQDPWPTA